MWDRWLVLVDWLVGWLVVVLSGRVVLGKDAGGFSRRGGGGGGGGGEACFLLFSFVFPFLFLSFSFSFSFFFCVSRVE